MVTASYLKNVVFVKAGIRTVEIRIKGSQELTILANQFLTTRLQSLKDEELVKAVIDKIDVIILIPMRGITVAELSVETSRLIFGRA